MNTIATFFAGVMVFFSGLFGNHTAPVSVISPQQVVASSSVAISPINVEASSTQMVIQKKIDTVATSTINKTSSSGATVISSLDPIHPGMKVYPYQYEVDFIYKDDPESGASVEDYMVLISTTGEKIKVPKSVEDTIISPNYKMGQFGEKHLIPSTLPFDPVEKNIVYLTTSEDVLDNKLKEKVTVYKYNLLTSELHEIYQERKDKLWYSKDSQGNLVSYVLSYIMLSINDNKLKFCLDRGSGSGRCYGILYLDVKAPEKGLQKLEDETR